MLNCLLLSKHFVSVLEKKPADFTDYISGDQNLSEKEKICENFARYY
jgi:hypothetical protein